MRTKTATIVIMSAVIASTIGLTAPAWALSSDATNYAAIFANREAAIASTYSHLGQGVQNELSQFANASSVQAGNMQKMGSTLTLPALPALPQIGSLPSIKLPQLTTLMPKMPQLPKMASGQLPKMTATLAPVTEMGFIQAFGQLPSFNISAPPSYATIAVNPLSGSAQMLSDMGCSGSAMACYTSMSAGKFQALSAQAMSRTQNFFNSASSIEMSQAGANQNSLFNAIASNNSNFQAIRKKYLIAAQDQKMLGFQNNWHSFGQSLLKVDPLTGPIESSKSFLNHYVGHDFLHPIGHAIASWFSHIPSL